LISLAQPLVFGRIRRQRIERGGGLRAADHGVERSGDIGGARRQDLIARTHLDRVGAARQRVGKAEEGVGQEQIAVGRRQARRHGQRGRVEHLWVEPLVAGTHHRFPQRLGHLGATVPDRLVVVRGIKRAQQRDVELVAGDRQAVALGELGLDFAIGRGRVWRRGGGRFERGGGRHGRVGSGRVRAMRRQREHKRSHGSDPGRQTPPHTVGDPPAGIPPSGIPKCVID